VAKAARRALARPQQVFHSGKLRAVETAEILAAHLGSGEPPRNIGGLNPNDDPAVAAELAAHTESDIMLVGHLPHMSLLASMLLCGSPNRELVRFPAAALLCLERTGPQGGWVVSWMITPEAL
jgi:phosphohistidine phosphatase